MKTKLSITDMRNYFKVRHIKENPELTSQQLEKLVSESLDEWMNANPQLLSMCNMDISNLPEELLIAIRDESKRIGNIKAYWQINLHLNHKN